MSHIRHAQLKESINVRQYLLEASRMRRRIDLHSTQLKRVVRQIKLEKRDLLRNPKCRKFLRLNPENRRWRRRTIVHHSDKVYSVLKPRPNSKVLMPRTSYQYKANDGYKYGIVFWLRHSDENVADDKEHVMRYRVTLKFMYRLRNGLFIQQKPAPWDIPFQFGSTYRANNTFTNNDIPIGLATLIIGLGIPETCANAMFKDISSFTHHPATSSYNDVTLCMEIHITSLQLEGEDLLVTQLRANVDRICRSQYIDHIILKNEANLEHLDMQIFEENEDGEDEDCCSICLEESRGYLCEIPCLHIYHYDCIFKWMSLYNHCPLCRYPYQRLFHPFQSLPYLQSLRHWTHEASESPLPSESPSPDRTHEI